MSRRKYAFSEPDRLTNTFPTCNLCKIRNISSSVPFTILQPIHHSSIPSASQDAHFLIHSPPKPHTSSPFPSNKQPFPSSKGSHSVPADHPSQAFIARLSVLR